MRRFEIILPANEYNRIIWI